MPPAESFWTLRQAQGGASSLRAAPQGESITRILAAAIAAVDPGAAVRRFLQRDGGTLTISDRTYDLKSFRRVVLLGIGKASLAMSDALATILGERLSAGLVIPKHASTIPHSPLTALLPLDNSAHLFYNILRHGQAHIFPCSFLRTPSRAALP